MVKRLRNLVSTLGRSILKEGENLRLDNERKKSVEFVEAIIAKFPGALSTDKTLNEPYRSLAFLAAVGQRPVTSLLIMKELLKAGEKPLNEKQIGERLARELGSSLRSTRKDSSYKGVVEDLLPALAKIGILESASPDKSGLPKERGFRIRESAKMDVKVFIDSIQRGDGILDNLKPLRLEEAFKARFDERVKHVIKSGSGEKQPFRIGKIVGSLLDSKLGISFETALRIVEEIEMDLKTGMNTLEIQSILYEALKKHDKKAAENYRLTYPEILSISMSDGESKVVNYELVRALINKEVKLKLTSNLLDRFASTAYNVITRNPKKYQHETDVREYIDALIHSEFIHVRSDAKFIRKHLEIAMSALEGCHNSLQSDEIEPARGLFEQFLEHICLVTLTQFRYLPFKDFKENVDLISNLLKQETIKKDLTREFQLSVKDLFQFQRIKFMMQRKNTASVKSLEKMAYEGERLIDLCRNISPESDTSYESQLMAIKISGAELPSHVSTGYEDLDSLLLGGIPENYSVILTSPSCDERDLLVERFLQAGIEDGQVTFHVTIDAGRVRSLAEKFKSDFYLFVCNPEADAIVKSLPNVFKLKGVENLTNISIALSSAFRKLEKNSGRARRVCLEILSDVLLQHHALSTRRWLAALIPTLKSRDFTVLAVMNPHMHSPQEVEAMLDLFQGEIEIYKKKTDKGLRRFLRIGKMYDQYYLEDEILLRKEKIRRSN